MLLQQETVLKLDYNEGYNLNFKVTKKELESILPKNLRPLRLKLLESDPKPDYYLSWYLASVDSSAKSLIRITSPASQSQRMDFLPALEYSSLTLSLPLPL